MKLVVHRKGKEPEVFNMAELSDDEYEMYKDKLRLMKRANSMRPY